MARLLLANKNVMSKKTCVSSKMHCCLGRKACGGCGVLRLDFGAVGRIRYFIQYLALVFGAGYDFVVFG